MGRTDPQNTTQTVLGVSLRALLEVCDRHGIEREALLAAAGLRPADVEDPDARVPIARSRALWEEAERRTGDSALALRAAEALPIGAYKIADHLGAYSATVGDGLRRIAHHFALIAESVAIEVETDGDEMALRLSSPMSPAGVPARFAELTFTSLVVRSRRAAGLDWRPLRVELRFREPAHAEQHRRLFGCPVRFAAAADRLVLDRATWELAVPGANPALADVLDEHARLLAEQLPPRGDFIATVREHVCRALHGGTLELDGIARAVGMSSRSLQRRLREQGTSFAAVVDEVRCELARFYLGERDVAVAEIAGLLGYSDQSAFQRAFKRWTGSSPRRFRQQLFAARSAS